MKKELEKPKTDKKRLKNMYEEMYSALGNPRCQGIGAFRKKFAQVLHSFNAFKHKNS